MATPLLFVINVWSLSHHQPQVSRFGKKIQRVHSIQWLTPCLSLSMRDYIYGCVHVLQISLSQICNGACSSVVDSPAMCLHWI